MKIFHLLFILSVTFLFSKDCSPYYNPERFYDAPQTLKELIEENIKTDVLFSKKNLDATFNFHQDINAYLLKDSYIKKGEYYFPRKSGFWKYKIKDKKIDEINISRAELYRFLDMDITNSINDEFENFWNDFIDDSFSTQLTPEQILFRYNDEYFSFAVLIYGVKGDSTPLKGTVVNFWFKDYTKYVNEFIQCNKENNGSR